MSTSEIQNELRRLGLVPKKATRKKELTKRIRLYHDSSSFASNFIKEKYWNPVCKQFAEQGYLFVEIEIWTELLELHERQIQAAIEVDGYLAFFKGPPSNRKLIVDWKERPGCEG